VSVAQLVRFKKRLGGYGSPIVARLELVRAEEFIGFRPCRQVIARGFEDQPLVFSLPEQELTLFAFLSRQIADLLRSVTHDFPYQAPDEKSERSEEVAEYSFGHRMEWYKAPRFSISVAVELHPNGRLATLEEAKLADKLFSRLNRAVGKLMDRIECSKHAWPPSGAASGKGGGA